MINNNPRNWNNAEKMKVNIKYHSKKLEINICNNWIWLNWLRKSGHHIADVKAELQSRRILAQDIQSHQSLVNRLRERLQEISNPDATTTVNDIASSYEEILAQSKQCVVVIERQVRRSNQSN